MPSVPRAPTGFYVYGSRAGDIPRHEYHKVQDEIIWDVVEKHFPPLKAAILRMLQAG